MWIIPLLLLVPGSSILWAVGGSIDKLFRRIGVGLLIGTVGVAVYLCKIVDIDFWIPFLVFPLMWGATSIGYGVPDSNDDGSPLGKFFHKLTGGDQFLTLLFTRLTVSILYAGALAPLIWVGGFLYLLTVPVVIGNTLLWSVFIEVPSFPNPWNVNSEELLIGAGIGLGAFLPCIL